jgi:hypothetical protein
VTRILLVTAFLAGAAPTVAQDMYPAWYARGELGAAEIHGSSDLAEVDLDSPWLGARIGRAFGRRGIFALDAGVAVSAADGGFVSATGGLELRAFARGRVSPFLRLEAGYMDDRLGGCVVVGWGGGLSFRVSDPISLRAGVLVCAHCWDGAGPVVASGGVEYRW